MNTVLAAVVVALGAILLWAAIAVLALFTVRALLRLDKWLDRWLP